MSKSQRTKGAIAERELANLLSDHLGGDWSRNLNQTRDGGHDLNGEAFDNLRIEVKRHETLSLGAWWAQAVRQAGDSGIPVLAYRQSRQPWRFVVPIWFALGGSLLDDPPEIEWTATVYIDGFCKLVRESV